MFGYLLPLVFVALLVAKVDAGKPILNFIIFVPLPDVNNAPVFDQGHSIIPAVQLAVEQVNNRTDILPFNDINILIRDSGCDKASTTAVSIASVIRDLHVAKHGPVGFIGPACPEDSTFVVDIFQHTFNLPVLYSGSTPFLSTNINDEKKPTAFGMVSSTVVLVETLIRIASKERWDWENVVILYDDSRKHFQLPYDVLVGGLNASQRVGYIQRIAPSQIPLNEITKRNIRLVVVISDKIPAQQLVCLAGQPSINFTFPIYQFIFIERSLDDFLEGSHTGFTFAQLRGGNGKAYHCNKETMIRGLNGSIFLSQVLDSVPSDVVTVSNYTVG